MRHSIKTKIFLAKALLVLLTIGLLGSFSYTLVAGALAAAQQEKLEDLADVLAQRLEEHLEDLQELMLRIDVEDYFHRYRDLPLARHFAKFQKVLPAISLLDERGREEVKVVEGSNSLDLVDYSELEIVRTSRTQANRVLLSQPIDSLELGEPVVLLCLTRQSYFGDEFMGTLLAQIPLQSLREEISAPLGEGGSIMLLGPAGDILAHPDPQHLNRPLGHRDSTGEALLNKALQGQHGFGRATLLGIDSHLAFAPVPAAGWTVLATLSHQHFTAIPRRLLVITIAICLGVLALGLGASLALAGNLTGSIEQIRRHTDRVSGGDFMQRLTLTSGDELEDLANSFNLMTENLQRTSAARDSLHDILQSIIDPLVLTDPGGKIRELNPSARLLLGAREDELIGQPLTNIFRNDPHILRDQGFNDKLRRGPVRNYETEIESRHGHSVPVLFSCSLTGGSDGNEGIVCLFKDISERKKAEKEIEQLAYFDMLTELPNRLLLTDRLGQAITRAKREATSLGVLFLDLDHFKMVNDTLGHSIGDELLKIIAQRLRATLRNSDTIARLGGDEFIVILEEIKNPEEVSRVAAKINQAIAAPCRLRGTRFFTAASIGIALYPRDGENHNDLLRHADMAMYHAKAEGRNNYQFFSPEMNTRAQNRLQLENKLRQAVRERSFVVHYQQRVDYSARRIIGLEALVRWQDPEEGLISPGRFIPLAEETGLIVPLGEWVMETACRQAALWQQSGFPDLHISVNLSAKQFKQPDLAESVARILAKTGLSPARLELELTESILMEDMDQAVQTLKKLKEIGIKLSIDDFGTGYSSLSYLKKFPIDILKIDRSFVKDLPDDEDSGAITASIIALARSLGIKVVAEGVETQAQLEYLTRLECHQIQGFLFGRPVPSEQVDRFLQERGDRAEFAPQGSARVA